MDRMVFGELSPLPDSKQKQKSTSLCIRPDGAVLGPVHCGQKRAEWIPTDSRHRCSTAKKQTPRTWGKKQYFT